MRAQRAGTNRLIEARLRAYHDALQCGFSREEAMREAQSLTRRKVSKARKTAQAKREQE